MLEQLLTPAIFAVFATGFSLIWYYNRHIISAAVWGMSYASAAIAFGLEPVFTNFPQTEVLRLVSDAGYILSALLLTVGLAVRYSQKVPARILGLLFLATFLPTSWYWFVEDNFSMRSEIISHGCAAMIMVGAVTMYRKIESGLDRILFAIVVVFSLHFVVVSITTTYIFNEILTASTFTESLFLEVINFTVSLIALSLAVVLFVGLGVEIITGLRKETQTDTLTGVANRRGFETLAREVIGNTNDAIPNSLIVCDIDHFKKVNDRFGHLVGDEILKVFADVLKTSSRDSDPVGRVGGEEFCILLQTSSCNMAVLVVEAARTAFEQYRGTGKISEEKFTASFGVAQARKGESYKKLFARADAALYAAKCKGRNRVEKEGNAKATKLRAA